MSCQWRNFELPELKSILVVFCQKLTVIRSERTFGSSCEVRDMTGKQMNFFEITRFVVGCGSAENAVVVVDMGSDSGGSVGGSDIDAGKRHKLFDFLRKNLSIVCNLLRKDVLG